MKKWTFSLIGILFIGAACNSYIPKEQGDNAQLEAGNAVDFTVIQNRILQPKCVMCHSSASGNAGGINVETYANVVRYIDRIQGSVAVRQTMPPGKPVSSQLQQLLVTWVSNGAPEHTSAPIVPEPTPSPVPPEELQPTFISIQKNIFTPKCISCHGSNPDSVFMSYDALMKSKWVVPNDITKSALYNSVKSGGMPPENPLTQNEIDAIGAWISDGAKNN